MAESSDDLGIPMKPTRPAVAPSTGAPARPPIVPPRMSDLARPSDSPRPLDPVRLADSARRPSDAAEQPRPNSELRRLSVGPEITLSGEINSCDKLFIEGSVEANLTNCRDVDIAEFGLV